MATPLGTAFSRVDALKRQLYDMITNPRDAAAMLGGRIVESGQQAEALQQQAFGDPQNPFRVTDPQAMARLTDMLMAGPMGFAPAGTISGATRDVIRSSADDLANQLNELGFQATVQHSGSRAGPSSYVQVYDPQTGRMFTNPVRFSGHGKGPREAAGVIEVQDPATDIPKIVQDALQMRQQGPSEMFQRQAIVDDLIAVGMKPKQAYKEADKRIAGLLGEPAKSVNLQSIVEKAKNKNIDLQVSESGNLIDVGFIKVPKRGKGLGTEAMQDLIDYADQTGKQIRLVPDSNIAKNVDPERLVSFYERLGFQKQEPIAGKTVTGTSFRAYSPTYWLYSPK